MKKFLSVLLTFCIVCSLGAGIFTASAATEMAYSFEGSWLNSSWATYNADAHQEGVLSYSTNTNKEYVTDGEQSFYILDNVTTGSSTYTGVCSPKVTIPSTGGIYKLSFDSRVLSGQISIQARFYTSSSSFTYKQMDINQNSSMDSYSVECVAPSGVSYTRILIVTKTSAKGEGYVDNIKLVKIADLDAKSVELQTNIKSAMSAAAAGTVIEIPDGTYSHVKITADKSGTASKPITIKAKNPGKVILTGDSSITISGDYINIEGIRFEECTPSHIVRFEPSSSYSKVINCAIYNCHPDSSTSQQWVYLAGRGHTVSGCAFSGKSSSGQMVSVNKTADDIDIPDDHVIENCFFGNIELKSTNGFEAIRIGSSDYCFSASNTTVKGCFFYKCDGEVETISVKSCNNIIKNNTFYNNKGAVVLRHGDDNEVYGNLFIGGEQTSRVTGVRIIGERQKVHDNYFYNLPSKSTTILLFNGCPYEGIQNHWYYPVVDAEVYNNTIIGGNIGLHVGDYSANADNPANNRIVAPDGTVSNNAIVSYTGTNSLVANGDEKHTVSFSNNYAYGKTVGYTPSGVTNEYFKLIKSGDFYIPENETIGADMREIAKAPKTPYEKIPSWIKTVYFDSALISFSFVTEDPVNSSAHINNIIPFDISYGVKNGFGTITLKKNGVSVSGTNVSVTGNPELTFTAVPDNDYKIECWYVNNTKVTESNINNLGITLDDTKANTLTINDITEKYDIMVEYSEIPKIPESLSNPLTVFTGTSNSSLVVKNHEGQNVTIEGCYAAIGAKIPVVETFEITEYGMLVSKDSKNYKVKAEALIDLTSDGAFGILFHGFDANKTYYVKPYAVYYDSALSQSRTVEGSVQTFKVSK